ncbi:MAG: ROK family protein, partial [Planctomycetota bacterium]|nr:ROK family protein [Planctomycetota bacterium]
SDIAAELGITPATITSICNEFFQKNLLVQRQKCDTPGKVGRRKLPVELNYDYKLVLSININTTGTDISICNLAGNLLRGIGIPTDPTLPPERFLRQVAECCVKLLWDSDLAGKELLGAGVTVLGPVDNREGTALKAYSVWGQPVPVKSILESELRIPVYVESNVCALAEAVLLYGEAGDAPNILVVHWGPGLGSATIIGGKLFKGRNHQTAELGHNFIDGSGARCRCGKVGCLETKVSVAAILARVEQIANLPGRTPLRILAERIGPLRRDNLDAYLDTPFPPLDEYLDDISFRLAVAVNNAVQILAPDKIILFGEMFANDGLYERFRRSLPTINETIVDGMFLRSAFQSRRLYIGGGACAVKRFLVDTGGLNGS